MSIESFLLIVTSSILIYELCFNNNRGRKEKSNDPKHSWDDVSYFALDNREPYILGFRLFVSKKERDLIGYSEYAELDYLYNIKSLTVDTNLPYELDRITGYHKKRKISQ